MVIEQANTTSLPAAHSHFHNGILFPFSRRKIEGIEEEEEEKNEEFTRLHRNRNRKESSMAGI